MDGFIINNTDRSRHYLKRKVLPGQRVSLEYAHDLLGKRVPKGESFVSWFKENHLPQGFELVVAVEVSEGVHDSKLMYKETLLAQPIVTGSVPPDLDTFYIKENSVDLPDVVSADIEDSVPDGIQYASPRAIGKLTSRELASLRLKDNPKRVLKGIDSIHKLRRAFNLCKDKPGKAVLARLIKSRIRTLQVTL